MNTAAKKTTLIIGCSIIIIVGGLLALIFVGIYTTNRWFIQIAWDAQFQNKKTVRARIEEWKPILAEIQANKEPERAIEITNSLALTYAGEYTRTGRNEDLLKIARWLCEQNVAFGKRNSKIANITDKLEFSERYLQQLSKADAPARFRKNTIPTD